MTEKDIKCEHCDGKGTIKVCATCNGTGTVMDCCLRNTGDTVYTGLKCPDCPGPIIRNHVKTGD